ncbi:MAG: hypothetical protein OXM61_02625 [Candidatus Poribacteria bacterium]|nr:hypothetical protein [Candidatus Poribacteria bacterium]
MKVLFFITLVIGLVMPNVLSAKNLALELDGATAIEVPNSDSLNPKTAITIEAWMNMSKPVGECLAKDWQAKGITSFQRLSKMETDYDLSFGQARKFLMSLD